jgi:hypothetical protein
MRKSNAQKRAKTAIKNKPKKDKATKKKREQRKRW